MTMFYVKVINDGEKWGIDPKYDGLEPTAQARTLNKIGVRAYEARRAKASYSEIFNKGGWFRAAVGETGASTS